VNTKSPSLSPTISQTTPEIHQSDPVKADEDELHIVPAEPVLPSTTSVQAPPEVLPSTPNQPPLTSDDVQSPTVPALPLPMSAEPITTVPSTSSEPTRPQRARQRRRVYEPETGVWCDI